ncbi:nitroreductase family protein [Actibacterium sp. MT2.3-13A]|uniref:nitroreductase family protein n=1 Tax=Actibacterium sp. MT2.3-13A TaxID=2828332 RepID=UPI001BA6BFDE|nr:nitroreductase family protein [Actibacterium sp. MT2.3-13A]
MNPILTAIHARRSVSPRRLTGRALSIEELTTLAEAAAAAPDHGNLGPLHLIAVAPEDRAALAEVFARAALEADPAASAEDLGRARDRALAAPTLIAIVARIDDRHPAVPASEQWISVGAGLQNALLVLETLGCRGRIVSGRRVASQALRSAFGLTEAEHLAGFIAIGAFEGDPKPARRRATESVLSIWRRPEGR